MRFYLINEYHTEDGWEINLPRQDYFGCMEIFSAGNPNNGFDYGIYGVDHIKDKIESQFVKRVSEELEDLIYSAMRYPPALMHVKYKLEKEFIKDKNEFCLAAIKYLNYYLQKQRDLPYFMVRCNREELGYKYPGCYYWVVGYNQKEIKWVSDDYFVYHSPIKDFEISFEELENRFKKNETKI